MSFSLPICAVCRIEMKVDRVGVPLLSMTGDGRVEELRYADVHVCPDCGCAVVAQAAERAAMQFPGAGDERLRAEVDRAARDGRPAIRHYRSRRERDQSEIAAASGDRSTPSGV